VAGGDCQGGAKPAAVARRYTRLGRRGGGPPRRTLVAYVRKLERVAGGVDSPVMLLKAKTWLVKVMPFLARWGSNTTPNP